MEKESTELNDILPVPDKYKNWPEEVEEPGKLGLISGRYVYLNNFTEDQVDIRDIAWGLGRILRYNGHISTDWTVAGHSIVMSYAVPEKYALEALLHDAAEAYIGDIVHPFKELLTTAKDKEDEYLDVIMSKFKVPTAQNIKKGDGPWMYRMSPIIKQADFRLYQHECATFNRPGKWWPEMEVAWLRAAEEHNAYWWAPQYAFLERFDQLTGSNYLDLEALTAEWFPREAEEVPAIDDELDPDMVDYLEGNMKFDNSVEVMEEQHVRDQS